ncbi:MAG: ATP synthase F0 subunit B [Deltaproteobacteria bacterium]|nr:ATP synthase F0 subunit B [Deltaproteobacteria bacterium]
MNRVKGQVLSFKFLLASCILQLATSTVFAAAEGGHEGGSDLIWRVINFAVLVGIIYFLLAKKLKNFLQERRESIKKALEEAKAAKQEAEKKYREYDAKVALLDKKVLEIANELKAEGIAERDRLVADAQRAAEKIKEQARITIEQEIKKAKENIKAELAGIAVIMAEEILRKEIKPDDQERLIKEYLDKMRLH